MSKHQLRPVLPILRSQTQACAADPRYPRDALLDQLRYDASMLPPQLRRTLIRMILEHCSHVLYHNKTKTFCSAGGAAQCEKFDAAFLRFLTTTMGWRLANASVQALGGRAFGGVLVSRRTDEPPVPAIRGGTVKGFAAARDYLFTIGLFLPGVDADQWRAPTEYQKWIRRKKMQKHARKVKFIT